MTSGPTIQGSLHLQLHSSGALTASLLHHSCSSVVVWWSVCRQRAGDQALYAAEDGLAGLASSRASVGFPLRMCYVYVVDVAVILVFATGVWRYSVPLPPWYGAECPWCGLFSVRVATTPLCSCACASGPALGYCQTMDDVFCTGGCLTRV